MVGVTTAAVGEECRNDGVGPTTLAPIGETITPALPLVDSRLLWSELEREKAKREMICMPHACYYHSFPTMISVVMENM